MYSEVDVTSFSAAHADGALVLDVREPHEYESGHVPGAQLIPLGRLADTAHALRADGPVYVICQGGNRSRLGAQHLAERGHDARSVIGGTSGWVGAGLPVVQGPRANRA